VEPAIGLEPMTC